LGQQRKRQSGRRRRPDTDLSHRPAFRGQFLVGQRGEDRGVKGEVPPSRQRAKQARLAERCGFDTGELGDRLAVAGDDDLLALLDFGEQGGEGCLGFVDVDGLPG